MTLALLGLLLALGVFFQAQQWRRWAVDRRWFKDDAGALVVTQCGYAWWEGDPRDVARVSWRELQRIAGDLNRLQLKHPYRLRVVRRDYLRAVVHLMRTDEPSLFLLWAARRARVRLHESYLEALGAVMRRLWAGGWRWPEGELIGWRMFWAGLVRGRQ